MALAQQRTRIFSLRPLRTTAVLWCEADALQAAGAAAGAGTVAATFGLSAPAHAHQKLGEHHTQAPTRGTGTVSSKLKVDVQDVARLCSRKSHVKVGRRLRAARRLQLGWVGAFAGREGYLWHVAPPRQGSRNLRGLKGVKTHGRGQLGKRNRVQTWSMVTGQVSRG